MLTQIVENVPLYQVPSLGLARAAPLADSGPKAAWPEVEDNLAERPSVLGRDTHQQCCLFHSEHLHSLIHFTSTHTNEYCNYRLRSMS